MAKKAIEMYEGKPVFVVPSSEKLQEAVAKYDGELEAPYTVRVKKAKTVKASAFQNDETVGVVIVDEGIGTIKDEAFRGCKNLKKLIIPSSVVEIGKKVVAECTNLVSIEVAEGNPKYDSRDNCNAIIETGKNVLVVGCAGSVIPDSVVTIGCEAFYYSGIKQVVIPGSVQVLESFAFYGCEQLEEVKILDGVVEIGGYDFADCSSLKEIHLPDTVTTIGTDAFRGCSSLKEVRISDSVMEIDNFTFQRCTSLTNVVIPDSVKEIGYGAFKGCTSLTNVVIPDSVKEIGDEVFQNCTGLTNIVIPDSVKEIGDRAFKDCTGLTNVVISDSVTIGEKAFDGCSSLENPKLVEMNNSDSSSDYDDEAYDSSECESDNSELEALIEDTGIEMDYMMHHRVDYNTDKLCVALYDDDLEKLSEEATREFASALEEALKSQCDGLDIECRDNCIFASEVIDGEVCKKAILILWNTLQCVKQNRYNAVIGLTIYGDTASGHVAIWHTLTYMDIFTSYGELCLNQEENEDGELVFTDSEGEVDGDLLAELICDKVTFSAEPFEEDEEMHDKFNEILFPAFQDLFSF